MPATAQVTPGATATPSTAVDAAFLNQLGTPTVTIPDGSLAPEQLKQDELVEALGESLRGSNYLAQGLPDPAGWVNAAGLDSAAGSRTYNAPGWWSQPTGATMQTSRSAEGASGENGFSLKVAGAASVTAIDVGTYLKPAGAAHLSNKTISVSVYVGNYTGAAVTPRLRIETSNAVGNSDPGGQTSRYDQAASEPVPHGEWKRLTWEGLDASTFANFANGAMLVLQLPAIDSTGKYVLIAKMQVEASAAATPWVNPLPVIAEQRDWALAGESEQSRGASNAWRSGAVSVGEDNASGGLLNVGKGIAQATSAPGVILNVRNTAADGAARVRISDQSGSAAIDLEYDNDADLAKIKALLSKLVLHTSTGGIEQHPGGNFKRLINPNGSIEAPGVMEFYKSVELVNATIGTTAQDILTTTDLPGWGASSIKQAMQLQWFIIHDKDATSGQKSATGCGNWFLAYRPSTPEWHLGSASTGSYGTGGTSISNPAISRPDNQTIGFTPSGGYGTQWICNLSAGLPLQFKYTSAPADGTTLILLRALVWRNSTVS